MGYKNFLAGDPALAAEVNSYLMGQTVARFPNATTRASQLPSPTFNQLSMLDDRAGNIQFWNGSAWVDYAPQLAAGWWIQMGTTVLTTNSSGGGGISFGTAFSATPVVTMTPGNSVPFIINLLDTQQSAISSGFQCWTQADGQTLNNAAVRVTWIAIGPR